MNFIRQKLVTLQNRARGLQSTLRRWALYNDCVSTDMKDDLMARFTPAEQATFDTDQELARARLRPVSAQIQTAATWFDFVIERVQEQFDRARVLLDQGRHQESLAILNDVEARIVNPHAETLAFIFRSFEQHNSPEYHQKLAAIDAIIRDMYLPTIKLTHQRGGVGKDALARTPVAYLTDGPDCSFTWRQHARQASNLGRKLPVSLLAVPRHFTTHAWNLVALAHEVGAYIYGDLDLCWEVASKIQTEGPNTGISTAGMPMWVRWHEVLFADVFGTLKLGPTYVSGMIELLGREVASPEAWRLDLPVPPTYIRWHVMLQTLQLLSFTDEARERYNQVHMLAGDPNQVAQQFGAIWLQLVNECRAAAGIIAFSPCQRLGGVRVIDVVPPFLATEMQGAVKAKDLLLAGDESCVHDENFSWAECARGIPTPAALAALRLAFENTTEYQVSCRLAVRFWCLMQFLTGNADTTREKEDREFAPGKTELRDIAQQAVPALA